MSIGFKNLFNLESNSQDEILFDENGHEITFNEEINKDSIIEDNIFDENGCEIKCSDKKDNNLIEYVEELSTMELDNSGVGNIYSVDRNTIVIYFAELDNSAKGNLKIQNQWVMTDENSGSFFIFSKNELLKDKWLVLRDSEDNSIIWESAIIPIPSGCINVGYENLMANYMTKKAIYKANMPVGDKLYFAEIEECDECTFALEVIDADTLKDESEDSNGLSFEENTSSFNSETENSKREDLSLIEEFYIDTEAENDEHIECEEECIKEQKIEDVNMFSRIVESYMMRENSQLKITDFSCNDYILNGELIVEKSGNKYTAVFRGFGNKNITLLDGEKTYFEFNYGVALFMKKIETMLINMFDFTVEDVANFRKVILTDEDYESEDSNVEIISRRDAIVKIADKGTNIVYIGADCVYVSIVKDSRRVEVVDYADSEFVINLINETNAEDIVVKNSIKDDFTVIRDLI